jgi:hypothetical protein
VRRRSKKQAAPCGTACALAGIQVSFFSSELGVFHIAFGLARSFDLIEGAGRVEKGLVSLRGEQVLIGERPFSAVGSEILIVELL